MLGVLCTVPVDIALLHAETEILPVSAQEEEYVNLDLQDADLADVVKLISEATGKNFILDEKVRGKVTVISPTKVSREEAYRVFESILNVKGFTTVPSGKVIKIIPMREAAGHDIDTGLSEKWIPSSDTFITRLIPMNYIDATAISNALKPLVSRESSMVPYGPSNTIILTESASNIKRILRIIQQLDKEGAEQQLQVIAIKYANAADIAQTILAIFGEEKQSTRPSKRKKSRKAGETASVTGEDGVHVISKIIPDERTNSIIVLANAIALRKIKDLIAMLDYELPIEEKGKINVHYLENADAEELSKVLASLTSGTGRASAKTGKGKIAEATVAEFEGGIKITADPATNSLIIVASYQDYQTLKKIISKLDIPRRQVYIEAAIMEVSLTKLKRLGFNIAGVVGTDHTGTVIQSLPNSALGLPSGYLSSPGSLGALSGFTSAGAGNFVDIPAVDSDGAATTIRVPTLQAIINALDESGYGNVLSAPQILTTDNEEAEIIVGDNVPFVTGYVTSAEATTTSSTISREDVGIKLTITPQISESNNVRLDIFQEISTVTATSDILGPTTSKRSAETVVVVQDHETVTIAGLIQEINLESVYKVPLLGDIPILGWLFKSKTVNQDTKNLLIYITPHIIRDAQELLALSKDRDRLLTNFMEKYHIPDRREAVGVSIPFKEPALPEEIPEGNSGSIPETPPTSEDKPVITPEEPVILTPLDEEPTPLETLSPPGEEPVITPSEPEDYISPEDSIEP